ncbi:MAG TPA: methyltransferase domain-containing protein, partial [Kofleriaceae bacterium]
RDIDRTMAPITELWLPWVAPASNEHVLDIGCGTGTTTLLLADRAGSVTGVDISKPMLAHARSRAPQIEFIEADAATARLGRYDLMTSRFGVMFFENPIAAFANLYETGGRLAFVCWRNFTENDWAYLPYLAATSFLPPNHATAPREPGPFAFSDRAYLESILESAGFHDIEISAADSTMPLGDSIDEAIRSAFTFGPLSRALAELTDDQKAEVKVRLRDTFAPTTSPRAAVWLVRANQ